MPVIRKSATLTGFPVHRSPLRRRRRPPRLTARSSRSACTALGHGCVTRVSPGGRRRRALGARALPVPARVIRRKPRHLCREKDPRRRSYRHGHRDAKLPRCHATAARPVRAIAGRWTCGYPPYALGTALTRTRGVPSTRRTMVACRRDAIVEPSKIRVATFHSEARERRFAFGACGQTARMRTCGRLADRTTPRAAHARGGCRDAIGRRLHARCCDACRLPFTCRRRRNRPLPQCRAWRTRHRLVEMTALPVGTLMDRGWHRCANARHQQPHHGDPSTHPHAPLRSRRAVWRRMAGVPSPARCRSASE